MKRSNGGQRGSGYFCDIPRVSRWMLTFSFGMCLVVRVKYKHMKRIEN